MAEAIPQADPFAAGAEQAGIQTPAQAQIPTVGMGYNSPESASVPRAAPVFLPDTKPGMLPTFDFTHSPLQALAHQQVTSGSNPYLTGQATKPAGPSPEREEFAAEEQARAEREAQLKEQEASIRARQEALSMGENIQAEKLKIAGVQEAWHGMDIEREQKDMERRAARRDEALDEHAAKVRAMKVDPQKWFKDQGTAGSILSAIAIGAGAFAAAMPHSNNNQNQALGIIQKSIDRNIAAQETDIDQAWKDLHWQGDKNQKAYVRDQWKMNQMNERKASDWSHVIAMIGLQRQGTQNQDAIKAMDNLAVQAQAERSKITVERAQQMMHIRKGEAAAAYAAQQANSLSLVNLRKGYSAHIEKELTKDPEKRSIIPWEQYYALHSQGQGLTGGPGAGGKQGSAEEADKDFAELTTHPVLDKLGVSAGLFKDRLQRLAPESAQITTDLKALNMRALVTVAKDLKDSEGRISPAVAEQLHQFQVEPGDTKDVAVAKLQGMRETARTIGRQMGLSGASVARAGVVPGAKAVSP